MNETSGRSIARAVWLVWGLMVGGIASLILWVILRDQLPWWASALMLAAAAIAPMEAVARARKAARDE